jgi:hypothetical protein
MRSATRWCLALPVLRRNSIQAEVSTRVTGGRPAPSGAFRPGPLPPGALHRQGLGAVHRVAYQPPEGESTTALLVDSP